MSCFEKSAPLFSLSIEEFRQLSKDIVSDVLRQRNTAEKQEDEVYLKYDEAAKYLKVSKPTFSKIRKSKGFPSYQVSENRILFSKKDLDRYVSNSKEP